MDKNDNEKIKSLLLFLRSSQDIYFKTLSEMLNVDNGSIYNFDLFILGVVKRSLSLINGFIRLIEDNNFLSAAPLVRLHLDNLLQIYAIFLVKNPHETAGKIMGGKRMKDCKDANGVSMSDSYLKEKFFSDPENKDFMGLKNVYSETSKFIHFSQKHISSIFESLKDNNFNILISKEMDIPDDKKLEIILCMIEVTKAQFKYIIGWVETKKLRSRPIK